jgi:hypothetical protein
MIFPTMKPKVSSARLRSVVDPTFHTPPDVCTDNRTTTEHKHYHATDSTVKCASGMGGIFVS